MGGDWRLLWRNMNGERNHGGNRKGVSGKNDERPVGHKQVFLLRGRREIRLES